MRKGLGEMMEFKGVYLVFETQDGKMTKLPIKEVNINYISNNQVAEPSEITFSGKLAV